MQIIRYLYEKILRTRDSDASEVEKIPSLTGKKTTQQVASYNTLTNSRSVVYGPHYRAPIPNKPLPAVPTRDGTCKPAVPSKPLPSIPKRVAVVYGPHNRAPIPSKPLPSIPEESKSVEKPTGYLAEIHTIKLRKANYASAAVHPVVESTVVCNSLVEEVQSITGMLAGIKTVQLRKVSLASATTASTIDTSVSQHEEQQQSNWLLSGILSTRLRAVTKDQQAPLKENNIWDNVFTQVQKGISQPMVVDDGSAEDWN